MKKDKKTERKPKAEEKLNSSGNKRGTSPASIANLKSTTGEAGPGRPTGILNHKTRVTMAIEVLANKYVDDYNKKNPKKKIDISQVDILGDIFQQALNKARNGDMRAIIDIFDRLYGKATVAVELTGKDGGPITYAVKMAEVDAETDAWFKTWVNSKEELETKKQNDKTTGPEN